ncbi:DUF1292 domain-containing protein [Clostridium sp. Cult3]|uniref:DUF1292 domain-containing protein n=1 Tax=Clostridium sp. Cult3 TaxID=2079004 RepID=UPI001F447C4C|nr:DUF1292 domain-containing protein [Clostridium sp. Cult3]MCF6459610.1 DUF1292 domain-containing protein [Clostridium sp. Cult3]
MNKNHDENCGCGCEDQHGYPEEMDIIYLTLDDGTELECTVLGIFEVEDYEYIALVPLDDDQVFLYGFEEDDEGFQLINIEDDEEFETVSEAFYELFVEEDLDFYDEEEDYDLSFDDEEDEE